MTPDELRLLADEATPTTEQWEQYHRYNHDPEARRPIDAADKARERLEVLAPDLARLCAEYAGAFAQIEKLHHKDFDLAPQIAYRALAKMEALKS